VIYGGKLFHYANATLINFEKRIIKIILLLLFTSLSMYAQTWQKIDMHFPQGDTLLNNSQIAFANKYIGWIITSGEVNTNTSTNNYATKILKTNDGGHNWFLQKSFNEYYDYSIFTLDTMHIWLISSDGKLLFTSSGGIKWDTSSISGEKWDWFRELYFFNPNIGIAFSEYRWITFDGGYSWEKESDSSRLASPSDVQFMNDKLGWIVSDWSHIATDGGYIANTTDGGKTWEYQDSLAVIMFGVYFVDSLTGYAVGTNWNFSTGFIYSTTDGGNNWTHKQFIGDGAMLDVEFLNRKIGWITGLFGRIWKTTDGGENWNFQTLGADTTIEKIIVLEKGKTAYIFGGKSAGYSGYTKPFVLYYADLSRLTDVEQNERNIPQGFKLVQNYPNPFNPNTSINYQLPVSSFVNLTIYNILGKEVALLVNKNMEGGEHKIKWSAAEFPSGIYIARMTAGNYIAAIKLILLK